MQDTYLEITYRKGRPMAAYLTLQHRGNGNSARSRKFGKHFVVDYAGDGAPIGVEILSLHRLDLKELHDLLKQLGQKPVSEEELAPLSAA